MSISPADILSLLGTIIALYVAITGGRKSRAETVKSKADAATSFQKIADDCADKQVELVDKIKELTAKVEKFEGALEAKDRRIAELEALTKAQEARIKELEAEVDALQRKRK